ncbi:hypothetical protein DPMN_079752 [Dreissena polymorpha]|uniref:Uncharacterized protein n=1 Tax=Dreissena polymorpha TaxID=45954 RepID=A0A9D3YTN9_DREPO|nr:hypothetical protein DPMN_079752 [Dreissena polymorpha]
MDYLPLCIQRVSRYRRSYSGGDGNSYQQPVSYRCIATETLLYTSLIAITELNNIGHNLTYKRSAEQEKPC